MEDITLDIGDDGVGVARIATQSRSINTITFATIIAIEAVAARLKNDRTINGLVLISERANGFVVGADLNEMEENLAIARQAQTPEERQEACERFGRLGNALRALELCGKPVVAAISGTALGGGLELALACHHRVVSDNGQLQLGLPESSIGLMPGAGGTQRLPRLIGLEAALPMLLEGRPVRPHEALEIGLVDAVVPDNAVVERAIAWVKENPEACAPWDTSNYSVPRRFPLFAAGSTADGDRQCTASSRSLW